MTNDTFEKRSGTTDNGKNYEDLITSQLAMKLAADENVKSFRLSSNDSDFGIFDDVVLELETINGNVRKYALQLKYVNKGGKLPERTLTSPTGNFSIQKYFTEYKKLKAAKHPITDFKLIVFTNYAFKLATEKNITLENTNFVVKILKCDLFKEFKEGYCYKFEIDENENCVKEEYKNFFKQFYLYTNQRTVDELKQDIFQTFRQKFYCEDNTSGELYFNFVKQWSQCEGRKIKLNKTFMQRVIAKILLTPFVKPFSFIPFTETEKSKLLKRIFLNFNVTLVKSINFDKIQQIWGDFKNELNNIQKIEKTADHYQIDSKEMDNKTKSILLWIMDESPLIISENKTTYEAINLNQNGKFILLADSLSKENTKKMSVFRNLSDLNQESQNYKNLIEKFQFSIQGKETITLETLIKLHDEFRNIITTNELVQALDGSFTIGGEKEELPEIYIDRMLTRNIITYQLLDNMKDDTIVVISCFGKFDKIKDHLKKLTIINVNDYVNKNEDIAENNIDQGYTIDGENLNNDIYVSENQCSREQFDEICLMNKKKNKCHHFRVTDDGLLEWVYSKGKIEDVEKYRSKQHFVNEMQLFDYQNDNNNINLINGEPGMGKSTLMKRFKNNYLPTSWTTLIIIKNHSQYFEGENCNADDFIKYILDQTSNLTEFEKNVANILRKKLLITFLWDGLDEISDESLVSCLKIIKKLFEKGFNQWITTRNHLEKKLEDRFNVFSKAIRPFDVEQQSIYIQKRLNGTTKNLKEISTKIRNYINMVQYNDVLGIPLQIFMLTELFIQNSEKYEMLLNDIFSIAKLYEHFVNEKFNIYFKEKAELMSNNKEVKAIINDSKIKQINIHEQAALGVIFDVKILKELNIEWEQNFDEIEECFAIGIIVGLTEEQKNKFLHQSYAEYFVATYFRKNLETIGGKIKKIIFQDRFRNIQFMFDQLLADDSQPHLAVIYKNLEALKNYQDLRCKDKAGRNLLHLACSRGARYPLLEIEKFEEHFIIDDEGVEGSVKGESEDYKKMMEVLLNVCDVNEKDELFAMDSLAYADTSLCLFPIVMVLPTSEKTFFSQFENFKDVCTVAYYAIKFDYDIVLEQIGNIPSIETKTGASLVYLSALRNSVNCLRTLLKCQNFNSLINHSEKTHGYTPTYIACRKGHYELVKLLVDNNADINAANNNGSTPLHVACLNGHYEMVKLLIDNNANINAAASTHGFTPFLAACLNGHSELVKLLILHNADINAATNTGITLLHAACEKEHFEVIKLLITNNADINAATNTGVTPFYAACENGRYEVVKLLIVNNADINAATNKGVTPFYAASENGHYEVVKLLIDNNVDINAANESGATPFCGSCLNGHFEVAKLLIANNADINAAKNNGITPLYIACHNGHYDVVKLLIVNNADINAANNNGITPFYIACHNGHCDVVKLLIVNNADINVATNNGVTPFHAACEKEHFEVIKLLIANNADINAATNTGVTPFYAACENGRYEVVKLLHFNNADTNAATNKGVTPFYAACENGHYEVVKLLHFNNADINAANKSGATPFFGACLNGHFEVVKLLIGNNADINAAKNNEITPFYVACQNGHYDVVKLLIDKKVDINAATNNGKTPFYIACQNGHYKVVKLLIVNNADIKETNNGVTPFYAACENGHHEVVKLLIDNNADINAVNKSGATPFYGACIKGHFEVAKLLIANNADINTAKNNGVAPFYVACQNGHYELVKLLIDNNSDINAAKNNGITPFYAACENGHYEVVKLLIDNNADVNAANKSGATPFYGACVNGHFEVAKLLIANNADINAAKNNGVTPFYAACQNGHREVFKLLIDNNVDVNAATNDGVTPLYIACENGHHEMVKLLIDKNADTNAATKNDITRFKLFKKSNVNLSAKEEKSSISTALSTTWIRCKSLFRN